MSREEIRIPKEVRPYMPDWAEETILGEPQESRKQYRHGNLHIREYDDSYTAHIDDVDPRKDPLGHLVRDAPHVFIGAGCGLAAGAVVYAATRHFDNERYERLGAASVAAAASGYASYAAAKAIRGVIAEYLQQKHTSGRR